MAAAAPADAAAVPPPAREMLSSSDANMEEAERAKQEARRAMINGDFYRAVKLFEISDRLYPNPDTRQMMLGARAAAEREVARNRQNRRSGSGHSGGGGNAGNSESSYTSNNNNGNYHPTGNTTSSNSNNTGFNALNLNTHDVNEFLDLVLQGVYDKLPLMVQRGVDGISRRVLPSARRQLGLIAIIILVLSVWRLACWLLVWLLGSNHHSTDSEASSGSGSINSDTAMNTMNAFTTSAGARSRTMAQRGIYVDGSGLSTGGYRRTYYSDGTEMHQRTARANHGSFSFGSFNMVNSIIMTIVLNVVLQRVASWQRRERQ